MNLAPVADSALDVALVGRLDTPGVDAIETRVDCVGPMAIRMFITIAHAAADSRWRGALRGRWSTGTPQARGTGRS